MKATFRIPTEMYAFAEVNIELPESVTASEIKEKYDLLSEAFKPKPINEMLKKEFDAYIENQLLGNGKNGEEYYKMSPKQQECAQCIKRALKRLEAKEQRSENIDEDMESILRDDLENKQ